MIASLGGSFVLELPSALGKDRVSDDSVSRGSFVLEPPSALVKDRDCDDSVSQGSFVLEPSSALVKDRDCDDSVSRGEFCARAPECFEIVVLGKHRFIASSGYMSFRLGMTGGDYG